MPKGYKKDGTKLGKKKKVVEEVKVEPVIQPVDEPTHLEPEPTQPEAQDIPLTEEMLNTPQEPVTNINNCEYFLELQFNGETMQCYTNNLDISIQSFAKEVLTEMFVKIQKGQAEFIKKLTLVQARMLFSDAQSREIFLQTFYGLYGQPTKLK
jgi:hypothetical protein